MADKLRCFGTVNDFNCTPERECKTCPDLEDCVAECNQRAYECSLYEELEDQNEEEFEDEFWDDNDAEYEDEENEELRGG